MPGPETNGELEEFRQVLGSVLTRWASSPRAVADDAELWKQLVEVGLAELPDETSRSIAFEAIGRSCAPGALVSVFGLALPVLEASPRAAEILDATRRGHAVPVIALDRVHVVDGASATHFLVEAGDELAIVPADECTISPLPSFDIGRSVVRIDVHGEPRPIASMERSMAVLGRRGLIAAASELAGLSRTCVTSAVEHAKTRIQFDRPIGVHQAISHRCVDMLIASDTAVNHARHAAHVHESGQDAADAASRAHAVASRAAVSCAHDLIQVLGGMGFTWEHDAHRFLRRAHSSSHLVRTPRASMANIASAVYARVTDSPA